MGKKCERCKRPLKEGENRLCPACKRKNDKPKKTWAEIAIAIIVAVGGYFLKRALGGKGGSEDN